MLFLMRIFLYALCLNYLGLYYFSRSIDEKHSLYTWQKECLNLSILLQNFSRKPLLNLLKETHRHELAVVASITALSSNGFYIIDYFLDVFTFLFSFCH